MDKTLICIDVVLFSLLLSGCTSQTETTGQLSPKSSEQNSSRTYNTLLGCWIYESDVATTIWKFDANGSGVSYTVLSGEGVQIVLLITDFVYPGSSAFYDSKYEKSVLSLTWVKKNTSSYEVIYPNALVGEIKERWIINSSGDNILVENSYGQDMYPAISRIECNESST